MDKKRCVLHYWPCDIKMHNQMVHGYLFITNFLHNHLYAKPKAAGEDAANAFSCS